MKKTIILIGIILFISCKTENNKSEKLTSEIPQVNDQFQSFINQFPEIKLPIKIKGCEDDFQPLTELKKEISSPYEKEPYYAFGKINTNGAYIATISLGAADCFLPILTTYELNGERIDSKTIAIGGCGQGPCFECEELVEIDEELNVYIANNLKYYECNEDYEEIKGTKKEETIYKTGKLTQKGKIELTKELKK
ncbi:hypothetical protein BTO06_15745 [Tenacibaculum sp. SZ-18]|uniref:hypothetical protein n=1 Tax=Tenacibaculum sp. SZ-18 TaxID=754423 RepID=UPI000C2D208B|nr:hypothetical protein [Tenacibaculum sp. SZ-18]AUC16514.1 hypothetical protein BTO06_15745 [Tenacibaculum sp. SZ-18]